MAPTTHEMIDHETLPTIRQLPGIDHETRQAFSAQGDPFYYGWREIWQTTPDGQEELQRIPLTEKDLLDPQVGDFIAQDTTHGKVIRKVLRRLEHHYVERADVAVWSDLKIAFKIPGLTTGPAPDIFVVEGVEDRDRWRSSFKYRKEPGEIRLAIEVVSENSLKKDYKSIFKVYNRMEIEEYIVIHPMGWYPEGPFQLHGWRRDPVKKKLCPFPADAAGRLHARRTGILLGTATLDGYGLQVWNARTGQLLRTAEEERTERERIRAEQEMRRAEQEMRRAEQEKKVREELVLENEQLRAELEKLRDG